MPVDLDYLHRTMGAFVVMWVTSMFGFLLVAAFVEHSITRTLKRIHRMQHRYPADPHMNCSICNELDAK